jgi:hypothetical protein
MDGASMPPYLITRERDGEVIFQCRFVESRALGTSYEHRSDSTA